MPLNSDNKHATVKLPNDLGTINIYFGSAPGIGLIMLIYLFFLIIHQVFIEHLLCVSCVLGTQNKAFKEFFVLLTECTFERETYKLTR